MEESARDIERLRHILEQIDVLTALVPKITFDTLDEDKVRYYGTHVSQVEIRHFAKRVSLSPGRTGTTL